MRAQTPPCRVAGAIISVDGDGPALRRSDWRTTIGPPVRRMAPAAVDMRSKRIKQPGMIPTRRLIGGEPPRRCCKRCG